MIVEQVYIIIILVYERSGYMTRSGDSKYNQIRIDIESKIKSGHYGPGDRVPSENELAAKYGVSIITSRKALELLVHAGLIHRERGRGSFVSPNLADRRTDEHQGIVTFILLSYDFADSSTMQLIKGAYTVLTDKKKSMIVEYSRDDVSRERDILENCIRDRSEGVLLFSAGPEENSDVLLKMTQNRVPFVLVDRGISGFPVNIVSCYNLDGAYQAARHLIETGHKRILFVGNNRHILTECLRLDGLMMAMKEAGLPPENATVRFDFMRRPLAFLEDLEEKRPTAIMCVNDLVACRLTEILRENDIAVPGDISVTGFDDADIAKYNHPRLTTVKQDFFEIGRKAAELLVELIYNPRESCTQIYLPVGLIVRESTAPADEKKRRGDRSADQ